MNKFKSTAAVFLLSLLVASSAFAADFITPPNGSNSLSLPSEKSYKNLYTAGDNIVVNSNILSDLVAAGGLIKVIGEVEDDAILVGGTLDLTGAIGGNARLAGGNININGGIGQDLLAAGGNIYVDQNAPIGGDFIAAGNNIDIQSRVSGNVKIIGGSVTINNVVDGSVTVRAGQSLVFGPNSIVNGTIVYYGNNEAVISEGAQVSQFSRQPLPKTSINEKLFAKGLFGAGIIVTLIAWYLASLFLLYFARETLENTTDLMQSEPWAGLGIGLLSLIIGPVIIIALLLTIFGYYIALLAGLVYLLALSLSCLVGAIFLGKELYRFINPNLIRIDWQVLLLGVVAVKILELIPFFGWFIMSILSLMAFGTIMRLTWANFRQPKADTPPDQPAI